MTAVKAVHEGEAFAGERTAIREGEASAGQRAATAEVRDADAWPLRTRDAGARYSAGAVRMEWEGRSFMVREPHHERGQGGSQRNANKDEANPNDAANEDAPSVGDPDAERQQVPGTASARVLPEKLLAKLWMARAGRRMRTTDGRKLKVVYPGRPAPGHGPDFRDAVIEMEGHRVRGPVELHRTPSDWSAHGHDADPAYDGVVLHVVGDATGEGGPDVPVVEMGQETASSEAEALDAGLPLARLAGLADEALRAALHRAGLARFRGRVEEAALRIERHGVEQALHAAIFDALGYTENREPFKELANRLPAATLRAAALAYPSARRGELLRDLLVSASGLEEPSTAWLTLGGTAPMERGAWKLAGVRPSNAPVRRMEDAAVLVAWALPQGLARALADECLQGPKALVQALRQATESGGGMGEQRAKEVAVNAVLPVLTAWARAKRDRVLARAAVNGYEGFPALGENTVTREARRLLGERGEKLRLSACEHQGLMRLYKRAVSGER